MKLKVEENRTWNWSVIVEIKIYKNTKLYEI